MTRAMIDGLGRRISYVRLSVTDRCDLRCRYCMAEHMSFRPTVELLSFDEIEMLADLLVERGVTRLRLTGGEPLVRRGILGLVARLGERLGHGLEELTLTTNGSQLDGAAETLFASGVRRINVSLDSLDPDRFRHITRHGDLSRVIGGIAAAKAAGLAIKINMVALKDLNQDEIPAMLAWCVEQGHDLSLIETMPLGAIDEDRADRFVPLTAVFDDLSRRFDLIRDPRSTGGPARYWRVGASPTRLGLISPLTANFCDGCNRVRLTTEGRLYACLGHDDQVDLKAALRTDGMTGLDAAIDEALAIKPARHDFRIAAGAAPAVGRHMSVTGG
jgi:cyclic pyranopterin phosphate synthase